MNNVLILDTETTDIDPKKGQLVEIGAVLWSVKHQAIVSVFSDVIHAEENPAEHVNGIPGSLLKESNDVEYTVTALDRIGFEADCVVAHNADFDKRWMAEKTKSKMLTIPWVCTIEDMTWPKPIHSKSLINIALSHGVAVTSAHRAIHDCLLLARLFEAIPDIGERLEKALAHSLLPKAEIFSLAPFEQKDTVKEHGFHWDPTRRIWHRTMCIEDTKDLPFKTRIA